MNATIEGLQLQNLVIHRGDSLLLRMAQCTIPFGTVALIRGPSGCGKTTLLRVIAGLNRATAGSLRWRGRCWADDSTWTPPWKRNISMVFQDGALWSHLNVQEHLALAGARQSDSGFQREVLERLQLADLRRAKPNELSGGQQQRLGIARAVCAQPELLLLDEPLSAVDASLRQQVWEALMDWRRRLRQTVLIVTHAPEPIQAGLYIEFRDRQLHVRGDT
ncbi:MAG: ATP-binding cassette domain-containing protein [Pseudomonadota bacterium]